MQRQHVQRGLHLVAVLGHGRLQSLRGVGRVIGTQIIGFVVKHPVAPGMLEHQVGKAHQHAVQLGVGQLRTAHPGQQMLLAQGIDLARVQPVGRQPELHLGEHNAQGV